MAIRIEKNADGDGSYRLYDASGALRGRHGNADNMAEHYGFLMERHDKALNLLERAAERLTDANPPDETWWRDYFLLNGIHMILGEYGWEPGSAKAEYLKDDPDWQPFDEVCAPTVIPCDGQLTITGL